MKDRDKSKLAHDTIKAFFNQIGNDEYSKVLLDVLTEGLYHEETIFVLGETGQTGHQTDYNAQGRKASQIESDGSEVLGSADNLAKQNREGDLRE